MPCEECPLQLRLFLHPGAGILLEKQASSSFLTDAQRQALDAALADKSPQTGIACAAAPSAQRLCRQMYKPQKKPVELTLHTCIYGLCAPFHLLPYYRPAGNTAAA